MKLPLSKPDIGDLEIQSVVEVLRSGRLSLGPRLTEFEERFASYVGTRHAIAVNSGTSALHLAVRALGIGPQDEVITTSFSFVASANCVLYEGALPVFLDIDPATLNLDPEQVHQFLQRCCAYDRQRQALVDKTTGRIVKAILPVHVFGLPCDMDPILELAQKYGLSVIEDSCEALSAEYKGQRTGTLGDVAAFAFYPNKQMTTGEGGMVVTDNEKIAAFCKSARNQGRDAESSWLRHVQLGYNYRLSELQCALGLAQLARLPEFLSARERVAQEYGKALEGLPELILPPEFQGFKRSWFVYVVQLDAAATRLTRDELMRELREAGIECQAYFPSIHRQQYLAGKVVTPLGPLRRTEAASDRSLALPFFPSMTSEQIGFAAEILTQILHADIRPARQKESVLFSAAPIEAPRF